MKFAANNKLGVSFNVGYYKAVEELLATKFLSLQIDNSLNWKKHIAYIILRLSSLCFAMRTVSPLLKVDTFNVVYYVYFCSIMSYGINFWGNITASKEYLSSKRKQLE
jgi:hypothetical protein